MLSKTRMIVPLVALALFAAGCDDDDPVEAETFNLTFRGDATFQGPHADQTITAALVASDGTVLETRSGTVSGTADPAFSFTFAEALDAGASYELHYWIDANFGGGTVDVCDAPPIDHLWSLDIGPVQSDVTITEDHDVTSLVDVCISF